MLLKVWVRELGASGRGVFQLRDTQSMGTRRFVSP